MKEQIIFLFVFVALYIVQQIKLQTQEPFTAKINQMWRPHYRNLTTYSNDTLNTSIGNIKRFLRQNGFL